MSFIDRKRIAAVVTLEAMGFLFDGVQWRPRAVGPAPQARQDDAVRGLAHLRAEEDEHRRLVEAGEAYARALAQGRMLG